MQVEGVLTKVGDVQQVTEKFKKREVWIQTNEQYPQDLSIQLSQDKADLLNQKVGDLVRLHINLRGRKWTNNEGKEMVFNTIECWKWECLSGNPKTTELQSSDDEDDDLPF